MTDGFEILEKIIKELKKSEIETFGRLSIVKDNPEEFLTNLAKSFGYFDKCHSFNDLPNEREDDYRFIEEFLSDYLKPLFLFAYKIKDNDIILNALQNEKQIDSLIRVMESSLKLKNNANNRKGHTKVYSFYIDNLNKLYKHQNIINFLEDKTIKSINDICNAIQKYKLTKDNLKEFYSNYKPLKSLYREVSRATLYRADKRLLFIKKNIYFVKDTIENYDLYEHLIKEKQLTQK